MLPVVQVTVKEDTDLLLARQRTKQIATLAGLSNQDCIRLVTAMSEIVRNTLQYASGGTVALNVIETDTGRQSLEVIVKDHGPGIDNLREILSGNFKSRTGMGRGIIGSRKLVDSFSIESTPGEGTRVTLCKVLHTSKVVKATIDSWLEAITKESSLSAVEALQQQNSQLTETLSQLQNSQARLEEQFMLVQKLNSELIETNANIFSLNKDLDSKNAELTERNEQLGQALTELQLSKENLEQLTAQLQIVNAELTRSNDDLQQFANVCSHDLQEPLRVVTNYTQLLAERYGEQLDEKASKFMTVITSAAGRMHGLISDLLRYSRIQSKGNEFKSFDCTTAVNKALANLEIVITESNAHITCDPLPCVTGDEVQLMQVFQNLIANAIKFRTDQPPVVHISAHGTCQRF